jgi:hypothetical protein
MVRKTSAKAKQNRLATEKALAGLKQGIYENPHEAAKETGAPERTVYRRFSGGQSIPESRASSQCLSPAEEKALVKWIEISAALGHPVTHPFLRELAEEIRKPRIESENLIMSPLGQDWTKRFMRRNPGLKTTIASSIEIQRKEVTKKQLDKWFAEFKRVIDEHDIEPDNVYNMDETGVP